MKRLVISLVSLTLMCCTTASFAAEKLVIYGSFDEEHMQHPLVKDAIERFEKKYDLEVSFLMKTPLSTDELHEAYHRVLSAKNSAPDILQIDVVRIPEFASMGYLADLTDFVTKAELNQFFPRAVDDVTWQGRVWAYPYFIAVGLILYRKDLVKTPPATWAELIATAKRLKGDDLYGYVGQMALDEGFTCNILEFLWSNGAEPQFVSGERIFSQRDMESLELMVDLVNEHALTPPDQLSYKEHEGMQLIEDGNILFLRHWPQALFELKKYGREAEARYAVMPIPSVRKGLKGHSALGGWTLAINKYSKHQKAAREFLRLLTTVPFQKHLALELRKLPVRTSLYRDPDVMKEYPWIADVYPLLMDAKIRPRSPYYPEISRIIQQEFHLALEQKISAQDAINRADRKIQTFLKSVELR